MAIERKSLQLCRQSAAFISQGRGQWSMTPFHIADSTAYQLRPMVVVPAGRENISSQQPWSWDE